MMRETLWPGRTVGKSKIRWARAAGALIIMGTAIAAVTGTFSSSPAARTAAVQVNRVSPEMLAAMTAGNSLHITTLPTTSPQHRPPTSQTIAEQTALEQLPPGSKVLGTSLANATLPSTGNQSQLVWLVSADPAGGLTSNEPPDRLANFYIPVISAASGKWLMASDGRSPQLPDLPTIPRP